MDDGVLFVLFYVPDQLKLVPVIESELFLMRLVGNERTETDG